MGNRSRRRALAVILVMGFVGSLLFMLPVFSAPVAGDDRLWFAEQAAEPDFVTASRVRDLPYYWENRTNYGRANVLTVVERRASGRLVVESSINAGLPTYVVNGALKLLLTLVAMLTLGALLRTLRCRRSDGSLARLSGRTVALGTLVGAVLFALGSQPPFHEISGRNGWVNYPTHSYGAVVSIIGLTALVLWSARLYAEKRFRVIIVPGLVLLAALTNFRYELVFPAGPLALIALLMAPVTPADRAAEGRRAKWVVGLAFVGVFSVILLAVRLYLRAICAPKQCYAGVTPSLGWDLVVTFWQNVAWSIPGTTTTQLAQFIESQGVATDGMYVPTPWSLSLGLGVALVLLAGWWLARPPVPASPGATVGEEVAEDDIARGSAEGHLLVTAAVLVLLGALGAAGVMSLSTLAQTSTEEAVFSKHTVITWAGLAWALGLGVLAVVSWSRRAGTAAWVTLSLAAGVAVACLLPANERSLAADRAENRATQQAFASLVAGDLDKAANDARCALVPQIKSERNRAAAAFDAAFRSHWGQEFCQR